MVRRVNNLYGSVVAPDGLRPVLAAAERVLGEGCGGIVRAGAARGETLRVRTETADLETLPLGGGIEHLLNGAIDGSDAEVVATAAALSARLTEAGVEHTFEVHDPRRGLSRSFP